MPSKCKFQFSSRGYVGDCDLDVNRFLAEEEHAPVLFQVGDDCIGDEEEDADNGEGTNCNGKIIFTGDDDGGNSLVLSF